MAGERRAMRHDHARRARHRHGNGHRTDTGGIEIARDEDREHARCRLRRSGVDAANIGKGVRRPDEHAPSGLQATFSEQEWEEKTAPA